MKSRAREYIVALMAKGPAPGDEWRTIDFDQYLPTGVAFHHSTIRRVLRRLQSEGLVDCVRDRTKWPNKWWWNYGSKQPAATVNLQGVMVHMALKDAVKMIVGEFVQERRTFSAWDVTLELRNRANKGLISFSDTGQTTDAGGSTVADVPHAVVRDEVHVLMQGEATYDRRSTGQYWSYEPVVAGAAGQVSGQTYDGSSSL